MAIEETSLQALGQWPWPRSVFAQLFDRLQTSRAIGIDINFKEPSRLGASDDAVFLQALQQTKVPIVLSTDLESDRWFLNPLFIPKDKVFLGFTNLSTQSDGVVRFAKVSSNDQSSFTLQLARAFAPDSQSELLDKPFRIAFQGPASTFPVFSVINVLRGQLSSDYFNNKIVLIGSTALDLQDYHPTPFGILSGVEIQANIVHTILEQDFYTENRTLVLALIALSSFVAALLPFLKQEAWFLFLGPVGLFVILNIAGFLAFDNGYVLHLLYPNLGILITSASAIGYQYASTAKERRFIEQSFSRYLAPQVINELIKNPAKLRLGGEIKEITVLFSDIRGFTTFSEKMEPQELTGFLNNYLTRMTGIILKNGGLIDKYIGDAIMAFWGAPLENQKHAENALKSSLDICAALEEFNRQNKKQGVSEIKIGIGLNSGKATVGNLGSEQRFDYTAIGDSVNLASRLEGLTKYYGVSIIASENTLQKYRDGDELQNVLVRELDWVKVKGKKESIKIFEIAVDSDKQKVLQILQEYDAGRNAYYRGDWKTAIDFFGKVLKILPQDLSTQHLKLRCQDFLKTPPAYWDGTFQLMEK